MPIVHVKKFNSQKGSGWKYYFEGIRNSDGSRTKITGKEYYNTKAEAYKHGVAHMNEIYSQGVNTIPHRNMSVESFFKEWLEHIVNDCKSSTLESYSKYIRLYIIPKIGKRNLKGVSDTDLEKIITDLYDSGMSRYSLKTLIGILTKSMLYALKKKYITTSPAMYLEIPKRPPENTANQSKRVVISDAVMQKIYDRFPYNTESYKDSHPSYLPLRIAYECGLRLGEVFALTWDDIDLGRKLLTVNRQIQWKADKTRTNQKETNGSNKAGDGYWYFTNPKYNSFRTIVISDSLTEILKCEKIKQSKVKAEHPRDYSYYRAEYPLQKNGTANSIYYKDNRIYPTSQPSGNVVEFILVREYGDYISSRTMQNASKVIRESKIMEDFNFHSLRHTHATMLHNSNMDIKSISYRLGHKDIKTTMNIYAHITEESRNAERDKINDLFK